MFFDQQIQKDNLKMENSGESGDETTQGPGNFFQAAGVAGSYMGVHSDDLEGKKIK